ncbi:DUF5994 family protein [Streptomyces sp. NPDC006314]|uniref:DUF5994 family protein n=1 Tax=Streptomyces sp. NPDC006314 TaxID=3154475 RepID=UPI0033A39406
MDAITKAAEGTAPGDAHTYRMPLPRPPLTPDVAHGPLDGARWPRCEALEPELPALVGSLDPSAGTVTRVTVGIAVRPDAPRKVMAPVRPDAPRRVMAPGHVVEVVRTGLAAVAHAITGDCGTVGRWEPLVIPPDQPAAAATWLLTAAAGPENPQSAPRLPALAESRLDRQDTDESEGGSGLR